jgi:hypothetical protein
MVGIAMELFGDGTMVMAGSAMELFGDGTMVMAGSAMELFGRATILKKWRKGTKVNSLSDNEIARYAFNSAAPVHLSSLYRQTQLK